MIPDLGNAFFLEVLTRACLHLIENDQPLSPQNAWLPFAHSQVVKLLSKLHLVFYKIKDVHFPYPPSNVFANNIISVFQLKRYDFCEKGERIHERDSSYIRFSLSILYQCHMLFDRFLNNDLLATGQTL